ncbi:MAG: glycoside hydrolase family 13 protein, partial [Bacteroidota bacterium]
SPSSLLSIPASLKLYETKTKKMKLSKVILLLLGLSTQFLLAQDKIQRVEPPNWWIGMKNPALQLLVYGDNIGELTPSIKKKGVHLQQVRKVKNPNYLFLDLLIDETAEVGTFPIQFKHRGELVTTHSYELLAREKAGDDYKGFDNQDVLYLITPDRFANGDPQNDNISGMREKMNRKNKGGRHGGDMAGIEQNLDYIADIGFTAVWLNPLLENDMEEYSYHGYSTTDFYKVDPRFGTNEEYRQLSKTAASKGIKMIMDMIVNHCGSFHWWMDDLPMDDWINQWPEYTNTSHRKTLVQDPYASEIDQKIFTDGWFVPTMPDLNQRNPLMGNYLIQNSIWWIEYLGLAGIRMDTYPYPDMDYMTEWTQRVMAEYPNFNVVGEEWYGNPAIVSYWQKGKQNSNGYTSDLRSLMDFPVQEATVKALNENESWGTGWMTLYEMLALDFLYADASELVVFPDNHDMSRIFSQVNEDYAKFKLANAFFLTTRGIPQIYYGTEILMKNPGTSDHGIIRSDFPGGWEGDKTNGFTGKGLSDQAKAAQAWMKKLLQWRKTASAVHYGKLVHFLPQNGVYVYFRYDDQQKIMVILNKNKSKTTLELGRFAEQIQTATSGTDVLNGAVYDLTKGIELPTEEALILELK